mgnify:CR=1 FL=1
MLGFNGGLIGKTRSSASVLNRPGIWSANEQCTLRRDGAWYYLAGDAHYSSVALLLPGVGGQNGTVFTDFSPSPKTLTRSGDTITTTAQSKYYDSSIYFDGTGDKLLTSGTYIANTVNTWTAESWVYMLGTGAFDANNIPGLFSFDSSGGTNYLAFGPDNTRKLKLRWFDTASKSAVGTTTLNLNQWYHIACSVSVNTIRMFVNGVQETLTGTTTLTTRGATVGASEYGSNNYGSFYGYINDLRVTPNVGRYVSNFTPPGSLIT